MLTQIQIRLQQGRTCQINLSDPELARTLFDQLRTQGVIAGVAIREIALVDSEPRARPTAKVRS